MCTGRLIATVRLDGYPNDGEEGIYIPGFAGQEGARVREMGDGGTSSKHSSSIVVGIAAGADQSTRLPTRFAIPNAHLDVGEDHK